MKFCSLLLFIALVHCISALEAEITQKVNLKDKTYTCLFKMRYEENTCLDTSKVFCSPKVKGKKKFVKDVKLLLDDGTIIYVGKLKLSKRKKAKIIECKVVSPIATKSIEKMHLLSFPKKQNGSTRSAPSCGKNSVSCIQANVDIDILKYGNSIQLLNNVTMVLTSRTERQATFQSMEPEGDGIFSWNSEACISGHINVDGRVWTLKSCGVNSEDCSDCYLWEALSNEWEPEECAIDDEVVESRNQSKQQRTTQDTTTIKTYTVNIWYTPEFAASHSNNLAAINTYIDNLFFVTNQGYIKSNIPVRAEKRCAIEHPTLHDIQDSQKIIKAFKDSMSKSELANSADVMALLVASMPGCGIAYMGQTLNCGTYSVTEGSCAASHYSFGHEIAHNFGASHNPEEPKTNVDESPYRYGHGHLIQPPGSNKKDGYCTILAYPQHHNYKRQNYYSSPNLIFPTTGTPTGTTTFSNNARVIMEQRFNMAACGDESLLCPAPKSTTGIAKTGDGWRIVDSTVQVSTPSKAAPAGDHTKCCATCQAAAPDTTMYIFNKNNKRCYCRKPITGVTPLTIQENGQLSNFCKGNTGGESKCFSSPGYPDDYPHKSDIKQSISVPAGHSMEITFEDFNVEYVSSRCPYDYVEFFDGKGKSVGGKRCGYSLPAAFNIGTSTASVVFHSDDSVRKKGFKFCFRKAAQCTHTDKYPQHCPWWKKQGFCTTTFLVWFATNCAKTCKC